MDPSPADLARLRDLYAAGKYRQAHDVVAAVGPVRAWQGTSARLIGGRLAIQLGAPDLGRKLHLAAFRSTPGYPEAVYYHARYRLDAFGPLACWRFQRQHPDWSDAPPELHADWLALAGFTAARLKDFDRAERWFNRADTIAPDRPWPAVERAGAYDLAERPADALAAARRALDLQPWFRPGVQAVGHLLIKLGRDAEALDFLTEACTHLESGLVAAQLAALQADTGRHADAARTLDRYAELSPMLEPDVAKWLSARRSEAAYLLGDYAAAAAHARAVDESVFAGFADRLSERAADGALPSPPASRTVLPLDLRYDGTPPTPYDLLAKHWGHPLPNPPADAAAVPDGLPDAAERARAEAAGWVTREFTLSPEAAAALIGRGAPFVLTLVEAGFSQPRLAVGADALKHTLFLAEPGDRRPTEAPVAPLLERFAAAGPRCLALVPRAEAARLDGLELPDAAAYDALYATQKPLLTHDRRAAVAQGEALRVAFPGHRLAAAGELALARYDAHPVKQLAAYDRLLDRFPHDATFVMGKANALRELYRNADRLAFLEEEGARDGAEALVMQSLAQMLLPLPGRQADADRLLRRSVRLRPGAASGYFLLATQWWEHRRFDEAAEAYRFAVTLEEREEQFAEAYVKAARATEQVPEAVRLFQQRAGRAAVPSPAATRALYQALLDRDEPEQAAAALDGAIRKLKDRAASTPAAPTWQPAPPSPSSQRGKGGDDLRTTQAPGSGVAESQQGGQSGFPSPSGGEVDHAGPADAPAGKPTTPADRARADLLLFRAECHSGAGRHAEADADLAAARPLTTPAAWHRAAGRVARIKPDLAAAGAHALELLKYEPLSVEAHRSATAVLAEADGRAAARTHLAQAGQRFPHFYPLLKLRAEFLSGDPDADADAVLTDVLADCPGDGWALRQRALVLSDRKRHPEALAAVTASGEAEPGHPWYYGVLAQVHRRADRPDEAAAALREGLARNIDQEPLITELVSHARGAEAKRDALDFVLAELRRQPHAGEGLVAFVAQSHQSFTDPEEHTELLETLEDLLDARPDLWQAWSVVVQQMAGLNRLEEANELAREATTRFPLLGKLWLDRAQVCQAMGNAEGRLDALRQAVAAVPGWSPAARELAEALDEADDNAEAVAVLRRNVLRSPLDPLAHGFLAEWLWEAGESREALDRSELAVRHEPGYDWAWHAIQLWSDRLEVPDEAAETVRELARERPGDPRVWLRLTRILSHPRHNDEVLAALDKVTTLDPRNVEAHDLRAERLAEMGRYDDALAAASPPALVADLPFVLQGRAAWVEAKRGNYAAAIPPMQALVAVDPKYVWGWHQLADWYNETGRSENYLEAASELVRLQPGHPVALTLRGEAKLQTGDRDGGKGDLRDALATAAGYSPAAAILFDAHIADEEFREARQVLAVLQEHLAGPEVAVKQIQLAARTAEPEAAARAFAEVCEGPGQNPFPIQAGLTEMRAAGWEDRALRVLRESWQSGGPFHPWAPIFWIDSPDGQAADPGERLRAADAVIKAYPRFVPGHDSKAEQLAAAGRYEEALAVCHATDLDDPPPRELRARAAWVEAKRGDRPKAVALMRALVAEDPEFVLGWRQLAGWYDAAGRYRECLEASDRFVALEPQNPVAHVYRGEAKRNLGDRRGAAADFGRAFEIDPSFEVAGLNLVTEQLATGDVAAAARTLGTLREHADGPLVKLRAVQVACRQGDADAAVAQFQGLAADGAAGRGVLREAVQALDAEGWGARLTSELKDLAFADDANPALAGLWAERAAAAGSLDAVADRVSELLARNPDAGRELVLAYAWALAEAGKPAQGVVQKYSEVLRADDAAWARAGGALAAAGHSALAAAWLADYRDRDGLEPWMLRPLATAYRALDQDDKALEVCRAAVKLGGPEELLAEFRVWLAVDLALSGQAAEAEGQIGRVDTATLGDGPRLVLSLAEAVVMVLRAGPGGKAAAFAEARDHLRTAAGACAPRDVPAGAGRAYRRVVARLAADTGSLAAKVWAVWQRVAPAVR
jgi:predicted Zn-dependent protease